VYSTRRTAIWMRIRQDRVRALAAGSWHSLGSRASDAVTLLQSIADLSCVKLSVAQRVAKVSTQHRNGTMFVTSELCRRWRCPVCSLWLVKPLVNPLVNTARPSSQTCGHVRLQKRCVQLSPRLYETTPDAEAVDHHPGGRVGSGSASCKQSCHSGTMMT